MKTQKWKYYIMAVALAVMTAYSCSDDDSEISPNPDPATSSKYVVAFQSLPVGQASVDYVLELPSKEALMSGEITVEGTGIPQTGWRFFHQTGNTLFTAGYIEDRRCISYQLNEEATVEKKTDFTYESTLNNYTSIDATTLLAVEGSIGVASFDENTGIASDGIPDRTFYFVDAITGAVTDKKTNPVDSFDGESATNPAYIPWVTGMVMRDGKLFLSYQKYYPNGSTLAIAVDKAYVAVLTYPELELEKLIEDDRTSSIGTFGPSTGIEQAENGDIYSYSAASETSGIFGATKPSGVLKISNGSTDFDTEYFFDVENTTNGGKIYWMDYIGNGKALARIVLDENMGDWLAFTEQGEHLKLVVLDLINKTVTNVEGMPNHGNRYTAPTFVEDGKAYVTGRTGELLEIGSASDTGETYVYEVDVENATAVRGAKVNGFGLKGIFKLSN